MCRRPQYLVVVLLLTMWASAGFITWTCSCCLLMGVTCPGVCATAPSVLASPSYRTPGLVQAVYMQLPLPPPSPVLQVPTPPPKALSISA